ncbi:AIR synthase family protein [Halocella sp. SP3-1]|uniref:AIR synthase family protein n=1 Tax=Halocella sp. SP3-1 TaxID=2382161 RepID=UPI000F75D523|nr:AIR synthase family protein [Halocella sp. SP3-1]AZO93191.1 AIR synthase [Halocella sp. SP3-1]
MQIGKIPGDKLKEIVLNKINYKRDDVLLHAGIGEDTAVIDPANDLIVISSDPITGASKNAGYLAVHVSCNDIASAGAKPLGIQVVLLLPAEITDQEIAGLMEEINDTARKIEVEVLGGHTEILSAVNKPIIVVTAVGKAVRGKFVSSAGAEPGDDIIITKGIGIEGTYILANDYYDELSKMGVKPELLKRACSYGDKLSVINEGIIAARMGANAMHDITEGGLYGAFEELSQATGLGFELYEDKLLLTEETAVICKMMEIEPTALISSGSMLITIENGEELIKELADNGIEAAVIGKVTPGGNYVYKKGSKEIFNWSGKDELWRVME